MKPRWIAVALVAALGCPALAHRLDEYLQATIISVEQRQVHLSMRLIPGVAVASAVLAEIDSNGDGSISEPEGRVYAERVVRHLTLSLDGRGLSPRIVSATFPSIEQMKDGTGEIRIESTADLPNGGAHRKLIFENHHETGMSAYLVNSLVPQDSRIRVVAQNRNRNQSFYELDYVASDGGAAGSRGALTAALENLRGTASMFRLGMRHIAEGTDHLLFLLVLLVPAPLLAFDSRWAGPAGLGRSVLRILKVVTAFTLGHSITLALAALGFVAVPSRPIEVLIAVSIFVSAVHALRPMFPGREAVIAAFFGLIHGLAFAATLGQLGLERWARLANLFAFNLGIETMQLVVVAATMPSLLLLSSTRTRSSMDCTAGCSGMQAKTPALHGMRVYSGFRIVGAAFAGIASAGWIVERLLNISGPVDVVVDALAHRGVWIAGSLFVASAFCWWMRGETAASHRLLPPGV